MPRLSRPVNVQVRESGKNPVLVIGKRGRSFSGKRIVASTLSGENRYTLVSGEKIAALLRKAIRKAKRKLNPKRKRDSKSVRKHNRLSNAGITVTPSGRYVKSLGAKPNRKNR